MTSRFSGIRARMAAAALVAAVGAILLAGFGLYSARVNSAALESLYQDQVQALVLLQRVDTSLRELRFRVAGVLLEQLPAQGSLNHLRDTRQQIEGDWKDLQRALSRGGSAEQSALAEQLRAGWAQVLPLVARIDAAYAAKKNDQLTDVLEAQWPLLHKGFVKPLQALIPLREASARATFEGARATNGRMVTLSLALAVATIVLVSGVVLWIGRGIGAALRRVTESLAAVASGDLSRPVPVHGHDEFARLLAGVDEMQQALRRLVGDVHSGIESVAIASREIAQGNQDLSSRTEVQAGQLQQTASGMDQLGTTLQANAENARLASQLASTASQVASRGGQVVGQVVATMQEIRQSSGRIADISGTIDSIAFQTNILALNAAVEAARAGDQGRGFAVVASEVRSLAQRSATAAREIKSLISASVERVEGGSRLVGEAGMTMDEIVSQVRRVSDLIGEISSATGQQSAGIGSIGEAVTQLDQMTQQNAALVEQSAAAATSLQSQAARLRESVAVFRLGGSPPSAN